MIAYQRALARALRDPRVAVPGVTAEGVRRLAAIAGRKRRRLRRRFRLGGVLRRW